MLWGSRRVIRHIRAFGCDTEGGITALTLSTFLVMVLSIGMAIDFIRVEVTRAGLQDALDRGVLAAAGVADPNKAATIVEDYLRISRYDPNSAGASFLANYVPEERKVESNASVDVKTFFLKLIGVTKLEAIARSAASLSLGDIEVSLVLDVSGSMTAAGPLTDTAKAALAKAGISPALPNRATRLDQMKAASSTFIDFLFQTGFGENTTVNLVPFSGHVNPGPIVGNHLIHSRDHDFSSCPEFTSSDYLSSTLPAPSTADQVPHFHWFGLPSYLKSILKWGWCPSDANAIEYLSNDPERLKERIKNLVTFDGTGTQNAMKWALGLLDASNQPITDLLVRNNQVDPKFADRPYASDKANGIKVIVLLSDGGTTYQPRPKDTAYDSPEDIKKWSTQILGARSGYRPGWGPSRMEQTQDEGRDNFQNVCNLAKDANVYVFTIGYDMSPTSQASKDLEKCATMPMMHQVVKRDELEKTFVEVVSTMTKLRLSY